MNKRLERAAEKYAKSLSDDKDNYRLWQKDAARDYLAGARYTEERYKNSEAYKLAIDALKFYAEPYTWSRVWADAEQAPIGSGALNKMYGTLARAALAKLRDLSGEGE